MKFIDEKSIASIVKLDKVSTYPDACHMFEKEQVWAINGAIAAGRPLLVKGEPGTGKSQLARAAAKVLKRAFVSITVNNATEGEELFWFYDSVRRLADAQVAGTKQEKHIDLDHKHFISPGPLWWCFDWQSAGNQHSVGGKGKKKPSLMEECSPENGVVMLIDEIDKADSAVPNSLLEALGNGAFTVFHTGEEVHNSTPALPPLIIVTSNEERDLPAPFLRRCLVLTLKLPAEQEELITFLKERGRAHFENRCAEEVLTKGAQLIANDRFDSERKNRYLPGQAEYLDLIRAVTDMSDSEKGQKEILEKISSFVLKKG